ncbi:MAG: C4-type zinc ribbon domain-containing protein [Candidatus Aminicenantes bacterium]|nr:C4-type zinc ribbon domain-containing protein [Candidatus Aminicenantes bacterium]
MKEGLDILYALQQKDDQLKEIGGLIQEIPLQIKALEDERDSRSGMIEKAKKKLQNNIEERKKLEREIAAIKEKISKYKEQMKKVTTNKEYQGISNEIKFEEANITGVEEKIIEKMVEADEIMAVIRDTECEFNKIAAEYNQKIKELHDYLDYHKTKLDEETKNKKELRTKVAANLLKAYDNLFVKKAGKVVSFVQTDFCGVCNIKIRPQVLSELVLSNDVLICESCGRILFKNIAGENEE